MKKGIKTGIIDRFERGVEKDFAIIELEDREILIIEKSQLPTTLKEGDKVKINEENMLV